jgi:mono/diheme cytochrome c family protein
MMIRWMGGRRNMERRKSVVGGWRLASRVMAGTLFALAIAMALSLPARVNGQEKRGSAAAAAGSGNTAEVARGKYLVEDVAMCGQCHSPRDANGEIDRSKWLEGSSVPFTSAQDQPNWPLIAPRIGGNPPADDEGMIKLLTTGIWTNGKPLRFPMMPFRMNEADARAVVAYLKAPSAWR